MLDNEIPDDLTGTNRDLWDPTFGMEDWEPEVTFVLNDDQWDEFVNLLDEPAKPCPKLVELFNRPSVFS
jgi:hypothetical protein